MSNILLAIAVLPAFLLIFYVYSMDKVEKEPVGLLTFLVILGGIIVIPAAILESILGLLLRHSSIGNSAYNILYAFLIVGCVEEGLKYLILKFSIWKSREFNYRFDAIVYGVCVGLGFALVENIFYVFLQGDYATLLIRTFTAIPAHAIYAVFMGYYFGQARLYSSYHEKEQEKVDLYLALLVPVFLHGFYDFCVMQGTLFFAVVFVIFVIMMDVFAMFRIYKSSKEDTEV